MSGNVPSAAMDAARALAPLIHGFAEEIERSRRLPLPLVDAMAQAGLFRLWVPRALDGEEADPMTLVRVVEEISRADGSVGWCVAIGGGSGVFGGYLPSVVRAGDLLRRSECQNGRVISAVRGGCGCRWGLPGHGTVAAGKRCQHSPWIVGSCRILDSAEPRLSADGTPVTRILLFPVADCEIADTWHSIGLRGTGSHDIAVADVFVPADRSFSFREPPVEPGPLYAMPPIALFGAILAAVPLGIARHAIDILLGLAGTKIATRSRQSLREDVTMQAGLGRAEALLRSGRAFLYEALDEAWQVVCSGQTLSVAQRATLWLASTHAAIAAKDATELMFSAGGASSAYTNAGLERCMRDILAAGQHLTVAPPNYQMAGQALLGSDMRATPLLFMDDRSAG